MVLYILAALFFVFIVWSYKQDKKKFPNIEIDPQGYVVAYVVILFFLGVIFTFFTWVIYMPSTGQEINRQTIKSRIYSLKSESNISGQFILGSGGFGHNEEYYCFRDNGRGGFYRDEFPTKRSDIYEGDEEPYVIWEKVTYKIPDKLIPSFMSPTWSRDSRYDIHVPKGTIIRRFEIE